MSKIYKPSMLICFTVISSLLTTACQHNYYPLLYRMPISQGNIINPAAATDLKIGMHKAEVLNLMGEPILQTPFTPNIWHYVYNLEKNGKQIASKQISIYFHNDRIVQIA